MTVLTNFGFVSDHLGTSRAFFILEALFSLARRSDRPHAVEVTADRE